MTMGACLHLLENSVVSTGSEYARSMYYGSPLFAEMAKARILDSNISIALRRMLLLEEHFPKWDENCTTLINILFTRIPMGQTNVTEIVANGFAHLSGWSVRSNSYKLAYLPDPVYARLAMCIMDEDFTCELPPTWNAAAAPIKGKDKRWWIEKLKEIFCTGVVRPEKGNFGEVAVGLYMLFCADVLRKTMNINSNRTKGVNEDMSQQPSLSGDEQTIVGFSCRLCPGYDSWMVSRYS